MARFSLGSAALLFAVAVPLVPAAAPLPPQLEAIAVATFVTAAADYVRQYEEELTSIVARETYRQDIRIQIPRVESEPLTRTLTSEVFFMFVERQGWMAMRDVLKIDDSTLEPRPDLRRALAELPASQVATRFKAYNARYNIGRIRRNFNEPTVALAVLSDRHRARFSFERVRARRGDDPSFVTLAYRERTGPTLIRGLAGENVFSTGQITLDPATGRVVATRMAMTIGAIRVNLSTAFAHEPKLDMTVPVSFSEHYLDGMPPPRGAGPSTARHEEILCEARYSDFQRFGVQTRIK